MKHALIQHLERAAGAGEGTTPSGRITRVRLQLARNENHAARVTRRGQTAGGHAARHPEVLRLWRATIFAPAHGVLYWISSHPMAARRR